jgi:mono/diheme cytochrome c family protein
MKSIFYSFSIFGLLLILAYVIPAPEVKVSKEDAVAEILEKLGDEPLPHKVDTQSVQGASVEKGRDLVLYGIATDLSGQKTSKQSKHFVCTSCHNIEREDPDLSVADPQARLEYVVEKGLPFLQGTALYGAVNRTSFYNDDYVKKYGDLVFKAKNNLREAIQLCAVECSQGRTLESWELESVLAYLWSIQLKLEDLQLNDEEMKSIEEALNNKGDKKGMIALIKSKYLQASPATFVVPPENRQEGNLNIGGNAENGALIYQSSCLHCHENKRYSFYKLDDSQFSFRHLNKHIPKYTRYSLYQVARWGTSPMNGKRAYMPHYTLEKMSLQQIEDLRAFIEVMAAD